MDYLGTRLMMDFWIDILIFFLIWADFIMYIFYKSGLGRRHFAYRYMYIELELNEHSVPGHKTLCNGILCSALSTCIHIHEHGVHNVFYIYTFLYYFEF